jgi:hypothetical protein
MATEAPTTRPWLATAHRIAGWATMAAFLGTGLFLRLGHPGVAVPDLAHRVFLRTHHLYLLGASLVNLVVASRLAAVVPPLRRRHLQVAAPILLLAGPPLLLLGFATEHLTPALRGEATSLGWFAMLGGVLAHLLAMRR